MFNFKRKPAPPDPPAPSLTALEELLEELIRFGEPRMFMIHGTWSCEVIREQEGAKLSVDSGFGHATLQSAMTSCADKIRANFKFA